VTDANGKLYEHMEYFPFGETWVDEHSNTLRTPYLFTGKEYDQETGLYYFGARYYDPRTSVWQSADPILGGYLPTGNKNRDAGLPGVGGIYNPVNLATYTYAHGSPIAFTDPDGRFVEVAPIVYLAVTGAALIGAAYTASHPEQAKAIAGWLQQKAGELRDIVFSTPHVGTGVEPTMQGEGEGRTPGGSEAEGAQPGGPEAAGTNGNESDVDNKIEEILRGATPGRQTKGRTDQYNKPGG
jgi:RHS repeat-associated protein